MVYHFTTSVHLPWILATGELRPGRGASFIQGLPDPDFLWATTDSRGERTMSLSKEAYRNGELLLIRLELDDGEFWPWGEAQQRHPEWTDELVRVLNLSGIIKGADPRKWMCRVGALPLSNEILTSIQVKSWSSGIWRKSAYEELDPVRRAGYTWRSVRIDGVTYSSAQQVREDGGCAYQIARSYGPARAIADAA
ncbi:hypothetical protein [Ancylobacter polymorphus]|uniref:Uncharacterized protein n=1 Tax=Ancylobacter polymorphus TaxID=223390 RepID=A0A9E7D680_9HYPH|nr:hypothetical protein [Ancylobacter polymorphus]UOK70431.1 hypothetical protein K9D25_17115 [Ancylobacter polymorphus]